MNERIRELALQAGEYTNSVYKPPVRSKTHGKIWEDGHIDWHELYNEKFAELLIEECKNVCTSGTIEKPMGLYYAKQIEKHFGVE